MLISRMPRPILLCFAALAALLAAAPAGAELVVLTDGNFLKVSAYQLEGGTLRVHLPMGGSMTLPLARVERVVDDEVVPAPPAPDPPPTPAGGEGWRFADSQTVPSTPYGEQIYKTSRRYSVNPELVAAVVGAESGFDPTAVSAKGALGLMQVMPATARRFGVRERDLFVPEKNLEVGTRYLAWLLERFSGDLAKVLAAYNAGEATVDRYGGIPPYRETLGYVQRVYARLGLVGLATAPR